MAEASRVGVRYAPDTVFLRLTRDFAAEEQSTAMFAELSVEKALQLIHELHQAVLAARHTAADGAASRLGDFKK